LHSARPPALNPGEIRLAHRVLDVRNMARSEGKGDVVDILVYVLWLLVLVVILQRA
jgi:hypothetical protein